MPKYKVKWQEGFHKREGTEKELFEWFPELKPVFEKYGVDEMIFTIDNPDHTQLVSRVRILRRG